VRSAFIRCFSWPVSSSQPRPLCVDVERHAGRIVHDLAVA
jgi:hypothetical protein